jgi:hypothetical protein
VILAAADPLRAARAGDLARDDELVPAAAVLAEPRAEDRLGRALVFLARRHRYISAVSMKLIPCLERPRDLRMRFAFA